MKYLDSRERFETVLLALEDYKAGIIKSLPSKECVNWRETYDKPD
jgi:hypothetical protein